MFSAWIVYVCIFVSSCLWKMDVAGMAMFSFFLCMWANFHPKQTVPIKEPNYHRSHQRRIMPKLECNKRIESVAWRRCHLLLNRSCTIVSAVYNELTSLTIQKETVSSLTEFKEWTFEINYMNYVIFFILVSMQTRFLQILPSSTASQTASWNQRAEQFDLPERRQPQRGFPSNVQPAKPDGPTKPPRSE